jgi:hypothetical protein
MGREYHDSLTNRVQLLEPASVLGNIARVLFLKLGKRNLLGEP